MTDDATREIEVAIDAAVSALANLPEEERGQPVERLEGGLAFARVCLAATDVGLITDQAKDALIAAATDIAEQPELAAEDAQNFDALIAAVLLLPVARGRDVEQAVKDAATSYQRSMAQRIRALEEQHDAARNALAETQQQIAAASDEVKTALAVEAEAIQAEINELGEKIAAHQAALDAQMTRHTEAFNLSQEDNSRRFQEQAENFSQTLAERLASADTEVAASAAKVREIADDVGVLAGAITLKETAKHYEGEADLQREAADRLRAWTVLIALGAVAIGVWAVVWDASDTNTLVAKIAVSAVLGALAAYTAAQSSKHRRREVRARDLQLQLTAFSPFIAPLHEDLQQLERIRMTRKTFGAQVGTDADEDDYGPNFLGMIRNILSEEPQSVEGA